MAKRGPSKHPKNPLAWNENEEVPPSIVKAQLRIKESLTGTGLRDFVFYASPLIRDSRDNLSEDFPALEHICAAVARAARVLDDLNWDRFQELPVLRQHCMDHDMHTAFFAKIEPSWKTLLTAPRGSTNPCIWLHIGTEPTSEPLGDLLDKMGWFGVNVGPTAPPAHLREKVDHIQLDALKDEDDVKFKELCAKKGGLLPKPKLFKLVFIKMLFSPDDPVLDSSDDEDEGKGIDTIAEEPREGEADADLDDEGASPSGKAKKKGLHEVGTEACGYGRLGVTRGMHVRRRLRALRNFLNVALTRLENEGTLLITWPALPFHPMLFFLTKYLRGLFMRVHLITPDSIKSWEIYILCAGFKREDKNNPGEGGGSELKSFLDGAYRANCLDDVLLWTLTAEAERKEVKGQKATLAVGYEELWTVFANKLESLNLDLCAEVVDAPPPAPGGKAAGKGAAAGAAAAAAGQRPGSPGKAKAAGAGGKAGAAAAGGGGRQQRGSSHTASGRGGRKSESREGGRRSRSRSVSPSPSRPGSKQQSDRKAGRKSTKPSSGSKEAGGSQQQEEAVDLEESVHKTEAEKGRKQKELAREMNLDQKASAAGVTKEEYEKQRAEDMKASVVNWTVMGNEGIKAFKPKVKKPSGPLPISRSHPSLSCSLGAAPGAPKKGFPDREAFVAQYPLLAHALDCTQHSERRWHRRRLLAGTKVVPGGEQGGLGLSEDLGGSVPPTPAAAGSPPAERRAKGAPSPPRFRRVASPPPMVPLWLVGRTGPASPGSRAAARSPGPHAVARSPPLRAGELRG